MAASKIQIKKICEFCAKEFIAYKTSTRFCSKPCNSRSYKHESRLKQIRAVETKTKEEQEEKPIKMGERKDYLSPKEAALIIGVATK